jgi:hypothetical protein
MGIWMSQQRPPLTFGEQLTSEIGVVQYRRLADAVEFYEKRGYRYMHTPFLVQQKVCNSTKPRQFRPIHHHIDALNHTFHIVASGEQSFLQLQYERHKFGKPLMTGKYQTITPCYRDERSIDDIHRIGFMKLELIDWGMNLKDEVIVQFKGESPVGTVVATPLGTDAVASMAQTALEFFSQHIICEVFPNELVDEQGVDIATMSGLELGSYGVRKRTIRGFEFNWVYGTGLAEPRLSYAMEHEKSIREPIGDAFLHGKHLITYDGKKFVECLSPTCDGHHCK